MIEQARTFQAWPAPAEDRILPRYPVYIPSKGRAERCLTALMFDRDGVPFSLVIEEQEFEEYASRFGEERLLVLPFSNQGLIAARNWIKEHSIERGFRRHWQFDDNIRTAHRVYQGKRLYCRSGTALAVCEDFSDRYTNVGISGFNYTMFLTESMPAPPFRKNVHVYSCSLINNELPYRWRLRYNDDTDYCLQVLAGGGCTILLNAFLMDKIWTMSMKGGNTDDLYSYLDGRLKMARALEKAWPGVVETRRRFQRPQHVVKDSWKKFDTPLIPREDLDRGSEPNEYGMKLLELRPPRSKRLRKIVEDYSKED